MNDPFGWISHPFLKGIFKSADCCHKRNKAHYTEENILQDKHAHELHDEHHDFQRDQINENLSAVILPDFFDIWKVVVAAIIVLQIVGSDAEQFADLQNIICIRLRRPQFPAGDRLPWNI